MSSCNYDGLLDELIKTEFECITSVEPWERLRGDGLGDHFSQAVAAQRDASAEELAMDSCSSGSSWTRCNGSWTGTSSIQERSESSFGDPGSSGEQGSIMPKFHDFASPGCSENSLSTSSWSSGVLSSRYLTDPVGVWSNSSRDGISCWPFFPGLVSSKGLNYQNAQNETAFQESRVLMSNVEPSPLPDYPALRRPQQPNSAWLSSSSQSSSSLGRALFGRSTSSESSDDSSQLFQPPSLKRPHSPPSPSSSEVSSREHSNGYFSDNSLSIPTSPSPSSVSTTYSNLGHDYKLRFGIKTKSNLESFRKSTPMRVKTCTHCSFCKRNGDPGFASHVLHDPLGVTMCPILKKTECQHCFELGHTKKYCVINPASEKFLLRDKTSGAQAGPQFNGQHKMFSAQNAETEKFSINDTKNWLRDHGVEHQYEWLSRIMAQHQLNTPHGKF